MKIVTLLAAHVKMDVLSIYKQIVSLVLWLQEFRSAVVRRRKETVHLRGLTSLVQGTVELVSTGNCLSPD